MTVFDLFVLAIVGASVAAGALRGFGLVESDEAAHAGGFL